MQSFEFAGFDGTILRGNVIGEGPTLVLVNGLGTTDSYWKYVADHFSRTMKVVRYDLRGHGISDPPVDRKAVTIESHARDLMVLIDRFEGGPVIVAGFSMGVQIVLQHYALAVHQIRALVLVTGSYRSPVSTFYNTKIPSCLVNSFLEWARFTAPIYAPLWKRAFKLPLVHEVGRAIGASNASREDMLPFYQHMAAMHPYWFFTYALTANRHSASDILQTISVPTLIIGGGVDRFTPPYLSQAMAKEIPSSELYMLDAGTHTTLLQEPDRIITRMETFFRRAAEEGNRGFSRNKMGKK